MKYCKLILLILATTNITLDVFGQANPFINVLPDNAGVVAVGCPLDIIVTIGNSGPNSAIPQAKLRPIIQVPSSVTFLPTAQQSGLPAGWSILTNNGSQIRICNSSDPIPVSTSRTIILRVQGVTVTPPQTFSGNINFGNGTTCAAGTSVAGDLTTDNSALSTIEVIAAPSLSNSSSLTQFSTSTGIPSSQQSFTLSGSNITSDIIVNASTGFEVSNTSGTGFTSSITVTPVGGVLSNYPVYVRLAAPTTTGNISGNVNITSVYPSCITPQNIAVTGILTGVALPLILDNFSVNTDNCIAHLAWSTSSEINIEKFEIEKSEANPSKWETIGSVFPRDNAFTHSTYSFDDDHIFTNHSVVMYRLKIIDIDASFTYSPVIDALLQCDEQNVSVFPNPVCNGKLNISLYSEENVEAYLTSITGQQLKTIILKNGMNNLDVSGLSNGLYILSTKFVNGMNQNIKVNIQK